MTTPGRMVEEFDIYSYKQMVLQIQRERRQKEQQTSAVSNEANSYFANESLDEEIVENTWINGSRQILNSLREEDNAGNGGEDVDKELFIQMVKNYPCIWDLRSVSYKDKTKKVLAWKNICEAMGGNQTSE